MNGPGKSIQQKKENTFPLRLELFDKKRLILNLIIPPTFAAHKKFVP
jgi:hypothetical protein